MIISEQQRGQAAKGEFSRPTGWLYASVLFVAAYLTVERLTFIHQLDGLGITLWGPSAGLALLSIIRWGPGFGPAVFLASLIADFTVYTGPRGLITPVVTSLVLAGGLTAIAVPLRSQWRAEPIKLKEIYALLFIVPSGVLLMAVAYCLVLLASAQLNPGRFLIAVRNFWIGDTLGILTLVPLAWALQLFLRKELPATRSRAFNFLACLATLVAALMMIFSVDHAREYQFFYLLFLPVTFIALREGVAGAAVCLFVTHVLLVSTALAQGYGTSDFVAFQMLMIVLSATGLLLGGALSEIRAYDERMRKQEADLSRATRQALVGATGTALAHEVSQPLSSTTNYLHAARQLLDKDACNELKRSLFMAAKEAERARQTLVRVRDYLSFGRLDRRATDVLPIAKAMASCVSRDPRYRAVNIRVDAKVAFPPLAADPIQLQQVFLNLIANAAEAALRRNASAPFVTVSFQIDEQALTVRIDDSGPGVSGEIADRLFEPFESSCRSGMGLGLTLVRQIVEAHGGEVSWFNREDGASFSFQLPRAPVARHE